MKEGWRYEKLDDLGTIVTGATPSTNDESNYFPKEYCFVKPSDLPLNGVGSIHETENYVSSKGLSVSRPLPAGSVLTTCIGTIGKVGLLLQEGCTNQQINAVIPNNKINSRYLAYALLSIRKQLEFIANAPVVPIINKKCFSKIHIGYPPKPTQLSIVSELDKLNELIQIKKEQLKDYDALAQSIFYEMFGDPVENEKGWKVKKLMEVCDVRDGTHDSPKYVESSNYMLITSKNIVNRAISFDDVNYITEEDYNNINKRSKVDNGDILMPMIGTIGNPVIVYLDNLHKFSIKNVALIKFLHNTSILNRYLLELMISESFRRYLLSLNKGGNQKFVALGTIRRMDIILPPLPLQQSFAHKIEQIDRQKAAVQRTIKDLETLLAARMQYWFD